MREMTSPFSVPVYAGSFSSTDWFGHASSRLPVHSTRPRGRVADRFADRGELIDERLGDRAIALDRHVPRHRRPGGEQLSAHLHRLLGRKAWVGPGAPALAQEAEHVRHRAVHTAVYQSPQRGSIRLVRLA